MSTETRKHVLSVMPWNIGGELTWLAYRRGYREAADALVLRLLDSDAGYIADIHLRFGMVYPIMFLYLHYIELEFKDLIAIIGMTDLIDTKKKLGHNLTALWLKVLECVEAVQGDDARQEFAEAFEKTIEHFAKLDPHGEGFRYPKNIKGNAQWDNSFEIDIATVKTDVNRLEQCCDELREELKQLLDPEAPDISDRYYFY
jgi:hypothetical protein